MKEKSCKKEAKTLQVYRLSILKACFRVLLSAIIRLKERGCSAAMIQGRVIHVGKMDLAQACSRSVKKVRIKRRFVAVQYIAIEKQKN
ncbi:MAG: hypothetical protein IJY37_03050 [Clostridia bacterium]|nr:hypothetical protein [Clostridia bacterium]MBQ8419322.1 hypothetical protein [Clostridia bacterium]